MRRRIRILRPSVEHLESRVLLAAEFVISEFMADNDRSLRDGFGDASDWIEIHNAGDQVGDLNGWYLTDRVDEPMLWRFPSTLIPAGEYLVVFASGKGDETIVDPGGNLHANFKLNRDGEYVALIQPDGQTVASAFGAAGEDYPIQFEDVSFGTGTRENVQLVDTGPRHFVSPTPGLANGLGINNSGPAIDEVSHVPSLPEATQDLVVSARISTGSDQELGSVTLNYRVMYGVPSSVSMVDDGSGADAVAADGVFTGMIPAESYEPGDMVRYFVSTLDAHGNPARKPEFFLPARSAEYFGTVVIDPSRPETPLPVLEWFVEEPSWHRQGAGNTRDYAPASILYNGQFYDNIRVRVRGGVTEDQAKPNFKFDFYSGGRFQYDPAFPRVEEINVQSLMGELPTRTYMRNPLAYQLFRDSGHATPISFHTHLRQNGEFYGLVAIEEQIDATFLQRNGLDPDGALYKASSGAMLQTNPDGDQWNKATRVNEDFSDLAKFTAGLALDDLDERTRFVFDNVDIPQVIHYLAVSVLGPHHDRLTHNYYVYRDTNDTGQWSIFPWDMDRFFPQADLLTNPTATPIFYGDSDHPRWPGTPASRYNRLNDAIFDVPETREMFVTHLRSVVDQWMNSTYLEDSVDALAELIETDAQLDNRMWRLGSLRSGVRAIKNTIATRREQLANDPEFSNVGTALVASGSPTSILVPSNDDLGTRWTAPSYVEGSFGETWTTGTLSVGFDRGTALNDLIDTDIEQQMYDMQKSVYLRSEFQYDTTELERLFLRMRYDDGFVAYLNGAEVARSDNLEPGVPAISANLSRANNSKDTVEFDITEFRDQLLDGTNVLAIHGINIAVDNRDVLILPELIGVANADLSTLDIEFGEIEYAPESGNQDEEYVTLVNTEVAAVDISGWELAGGIQYEFQPGTVIPAGGTLFVSPHIATFRKRTVGPAGGQGLFVQGNYDGHISNRGETIQLVDLDGDLVASVSTPGSAEVANVVPDFDGDGDVTASDIDLLSRGIRRHDNRFDMNGDGTANQNDHQFMIETILLTSYGDSDLDGAFDARDIVMVLQAGEYDDAVDLNSGWGEGDWNGDGDFDRFDLVLALQMK